MLLQRQNYRKMANFIQSYGRALRVMMSSKWHYKARSSVFCTELGVQKYICFHYFIYAKTMAFSPGLKQFNPV